MKLTREVNGCVSLVILATLFSICAVCPRAQGQSGNYDRQIKEYVQFLQSQNRSSCDYILSLFDRYDLVILCERAHPEMTQYDLIYRILGDKRFTDRVGRIFTESGTSSMQPEIESFLTSVGLDEEGAEERVRRICRDLTWFPHREMTNYYELLKNVRQLNKNLAAEKRIHIYPSDMPFSWDGMTSVKYREFRETLRQRDKIMADQIADKFDEIRNSSDPRKKALVIMNYRHAFGHMKITMGGRTRQFHNVGGFLMTYYPQQVANVMVNSIRPLPGSSDNKLVITALQDGKWDAAFCVLGNPDLGFDFAGSPFGDDSFDYFPIPSTYRYKDAFTGFVFYRPLEEHRMSEGIPGAIDEAFARELTGRYRIEGKLLSARDIAEKIQEHRTIRTYGYENEEFFGTSDYKAKINSWLQ